MAAVAVILADGLEEIEAITPIDFLRRAGIEVITVGVGNLFIKGSHGITLKADMELKDFSSDTEALLIPGGMPGSAHIAAEERVINIVRNFNEKEKLVAAICAAPALVLGRAGILKDRRFTCYPGFEDKAGPFGEYSTDRIVQDGHVITACGVGCAAEFSARVIAYLRGEEKAGEVMRATLQAGY